jgi:hypothetical protein
LRHYPFDPQELCLIFPPEFRYKRLADRNLLAPSGEMFEVHP